MYDLRCMTLYTVFCRFIAVFLWETWHLSLQLSTQNALTNRENRLWGLTEVKFKVCLDVWCVLLLLCFFMCYCLLPQVVLGHVFVCCLSWSVSHYPSICLSIFFSFFSCMYVCVSVLFCVGLYFVRSCLPIVLLFLLLLLLLLSPRLLSLWYL